MTMSNTNIQHDDAVGEIDPAFKLTDTADPFLEFGDSRESMGEYLAYRVYRFPADLGNHVRRITMQLKHGNGDQLFGALLDFFIALGSSGHQIRKRMLERSRSRLKDGDYDLLGRILDGKADRFDPLGAVPCSVLSKGNIGVFNLVSSSEKAVIGARDPLTEAREFIEYSQIDEARVVLERAILQDSGRQELHMELLDVYKASRDKANFTVFFQQLDETQSPVYSEWLLAADFFEKFDVEECA